MGSILSTPFFQTILPSFLYSRASGVELPVEIIWIERDFDRTLASNVRRGEKGGHVVPQHVMEKFRDEAEVPTLEEGFARVRIFENQHDEASGTGGFESKDEVAA